MMARILLDKVVQTHFTRGRPSKPPARKAKVHKDIAFVLSDLSDTVGEAMQKASRYELKRLKRLYEIHPSSLPYCPLRELHNLLEQDFNAIEERTFAESYFTSVGTLIHTLIQNYMGKTGKVWGNWECSRPECSYVCKKLSVYHDCPKCGSDLDYREIKFNYKNIVIGQADCLYEDSKGNFWVVDYKTCLLSKAFKHKYDGVTLAKNNTYAAQQRAYVTLCQRKFKKYGIKIKGYILVYIPRDIPFQTQFVAVRVDPNTKKETWSELVKSAEGHTVILDASSWDDIKDLIKNKPCKSMQEYKDKVETPHSKCPLARCCFSKKGLENKLKPLVDASDILPIRKRIDLAIKDQQNYIESLQNE